MKDLIASAMEKIYEVFGGNDVVMVMPLDAPFFPIKGIFSETSQEVDSGGIIVTSSSPRLTVWKEDLPAYPTRNDRFSIRGKVYRIRNIEPDGYGNLNLELFKIES